MTSDIRELLLDSVERMMTDRCTQEVVDAAEAAWPAELWDLLEEAGLPLACVPEEAGGGGAGLGDALAVAQRAARSAAPVPLGETALAGLLLAEAGLEVPAGPLASAWDDELSVDAEGVLSGVARRVPWGRDVERLAVLAEGPDGLVVAVVQKGAASVTEGRNLAFEPRDDLALDGVSASATGAAPDGLDATVLDLRAALLRTVQIAGALDAAVDLSLQYASERVQFGRAISKFQAVQHMLTEIAAERTAARAAADVAVQRAEDHGFAAAAGAIAVAKVRASQAAGVAAENAHQVHGAIGFTDEHRLHHVTRRLWAWRDEHGSEAVWGRRLGRDALAAGGDGIWPYVVSLG